MIVLWRGEQKHMPMPAHLPKPVPSMPVLGAKPLYVRIEISLAVFLLNGYLHLSVAALYAITGTANKPKPW